MGASGVGLGAWGAHGLAEFLGHGNTQAWSTAVHYQLVHALALVSLGVWLRQSPNGQGLLALAGYLMIFGVFAFSGSIYLLTLGAPRMFGPVTPVGGLAFMLGWGLIAWTAWRE